MDPLVRYITKRIQSWSTPMYESARDHRLDHQQVEGGQVTAAEEPNPLRWPVSPLQLDTSHSVDATARKVNSASNITRSAFPLSPGHAKVFVMPSRNTASGNILPGSNHSESNFSQQERSLPIARSFHRLTDAQEENTTVDTSPQSNLKNYLISETHSGSYMPKKANELYFRDGQRQIDMVLAFTDDPLMKELLAFRINFERNLIKDGLHLELEDKKNTSAGDIYFLKIHAPWEVLAKYAEAMYIKMPLKTEENYPERLPSRMPGPFRMTFANIVKLFKPSNIVNTRTSFVTAPFVRSRENNFAMDTRDSFFMPSQRSMLVWHILCRTAFSRRRDQVGINKLLNKGVYTAAFPLHDGDIDYSMSKAPTSTRQVLYNEWGSIRSWYREQPLPLVRDYFGDKVGMYFAWLGFYTVALIPASIVGVVCFLYGALSIDSGANVLSHEICNKTSAGGIIMCPLCDEACPYWYLGDSCIYSKVSYLFDNYATFFFAVFMSLWATIYLELWKRRQGSLAWEWDLMETEFGENKEIRLEYELAATNMRVSPVTKQREPFMPTWKKNVRFALSTAGVLFICMVLFAAMFLVIIYRLVIVTVFANLQSKLLRMNARLIASVTAACINLAITIIFKQFGTRLIHMLTDLEAPRTQSEYEDSYIFKVFVFDFINVYSSLIYIAIFKGRFYAHPGDAESKTSSLRTIRTDVCDPSGCFFELCIQLAIMLIGRQILNNFLELAYPKLQLWWRKYYRKIAENDASRLKPMTRWEKDFLLNANTDLSLHEAYHEIVIQYGLVTLFVAAFPLAPLFALINSAIELRIDTYKTMTQFRRPVAQRISNKNTIIDEIMKLLTYTAVVTNAFVIAYSSEFIPRLVYYYLNDWQWDGYLNFTLSRFNTSYYGPDMGPKPEVDARNISHCYYRAMRNPSDGPDPHDYSMNYWYTTACRLAFVVVFEHFVFALTGLLAYAVPDLPSSVREKLARERLLEREAIMGHDADADDQKRQTEDTPRSS